MSKQVQENIVGMKVVAEDVIADLGGYPEVGQFTEKKALQKFYKQLPTEVVEDWADLESLDYKPSDDPQIHRMRVCMAILYLHFPKAPSKSKPKSKYSEYTTEQLVQMAIDNEVAFEVCDSQPILRMRAIMALRASGHLEAK